MDENSRKRRELSRRQFRVAEQTITHQARQLVGTNGFTSSDEEDLRQELFLDLYQRFPQFDPSRSSWRTYVRMVIRKKAASLCARQKAAMRDYRKIAYSLDEEVSVGDETLDRHECFSQDDYLHRTGQISRSHEELRDLKIDVERHLDRQPEAQRVLCNQLRYLNVSDVSRVNGLPRSTMYDRIEILRSGFEEAGFFEYLENGSDVSRFLPVQSRQEEEN